MTATTEHTTSERGLAPELVWLRRAQDAKTRGQLVDVRFTLDDGKPEHWRIAVGRIEHGGFWTPGNFFVGFRRVESLRAIEETGATPRKRTSAINPAPIIFHEGAPHRGAGDYRNKDYFAEFYAFPVIADGERRYAVYRGALCLSNVHLKIGDPEFKKRGPGPYETNLAADQVAARLADEERASYAAAVAAGNLANWLPAWPHHAGRIIEGEYAR